MGLPPSYSIRSKIILCCLNSMDSFVSQTLQLPGLETCIRHPRMGGLIKGYGGAGKVVLSQGILGTRLRTQGSSRDLVILSSQDGLLFPSVALPRPVPLL